MNSNKQTFLDRLFSILVCLAIISIPFIILQLLVDYHAFSPKFLRKSEQVLPWAWGGFFVFLCVAIYVLLRARFVWNKEKEVLVIESEKTKQDLRSAHRQEINSLTEEWTLREEQFEEKIKNLYERMETCIRDEVMKRENELNRKFQNEREQQEAVIKKIKSFDKNHPAILQLKKNFLALRELSAGFFQSSRILILDSDETRTALETAFRDKDSGALLVTPELDDIGFNKWCGIFNTGTHQYTGISWMYPWLSNDKRLKEIVRTFPAPEKLIMYQNDSPPFAACFSEKNRVLLFPAHYQGLNETDFSIQIISGQSVEELRLCLFKKAVRLELHYGIVDRMDSFENKTACINILDGISNILIPQKLWERHKELYNEISRFREGVFLFTTRRGGNVYLEHIVLPELVDLKIPESRFDTPSKNLPF